MKMVVSREIKVVQVMYFSLIVQLADFEFQSMPIFNPDGGEGSRWMKLST